MNSFFIVFAHHLDEVGPPTIYRAHGRNVVVYNTRPKAEAAAAELTATNKNPNIAFTVTEFKAL